MLRAMQVYFSVLTYLSPKLAGKYAYNLWFQPTRFKAPNREEDAIQSAKVFFINIAGYSIKVWSWGEGPAVLFLHGWSGRGTQVASFMPSLVESGYRVISFDGPAHGESSGKSTDIFKYSAILKAVIDQFGPWHAVITHSFGAMVFALTYDESMDFKKFIFIAPPATMRTPFNHFQNLLKLSADVSKNMQDRLSGEYGRDIFDRVSVLQNIRKVNLPILVIHDEDDAVVPISDSASISKASQRVKFIKTQKLGHMKVLYHSSIVQRVVAFFGTG